MVGSQGGVTEYSVSLPVRNFLSTLVADLETQVEKSAPSAQQLVPRLRKAIDRIPASLSIPIKMWIENGSLIKVAVSYDRATVTVGITHPSIGVSPPSAPRMITVDEIRSFVHWFENGGTNATADSVTVAQSNLETALTGARTSYVINNRSFADLLNRSSPNSIYNLDTGLGFVTNAPSTSADTVSVEVGTGGSSVTMTAFTAETRDCWGVLDLTANQPAPVLGLASKPGVYFFVNRNVAATTCDASTLTKVDRSSSDFFPAP